MVSRDPELNILVWSWTHHRPIRERYAALERFGAVRVVRLRSPRAARRWLADAAAGVRTVPRGDV